MDNSHEGQAGCVPAHVSYAPVCVGNAPVRVCNAPVRMSHVLARVSNAPVRVGNARRRRIKYKAWGSAPGTQPPNYCRATGAAVAVGVITCMASITPIVQIVITYAIGMLAEVTPAANVT